VAEKTGIRVSPCGSFIASGCTSGCIFVWSTTGVQKFAIVTPLFKLKGHLKEVNIVDWCYGNGLFKVSYCFSFTFIIFSFQYIVKLLLNIQSN